MITPLLYIQNISDPKNKQNLPQTLILTFSSQYNKNSLIKSFIPSKMLKQTMNKSQISNNSSKTVVHKHVHYHYHYYQSQEDIQEHFKQVQFQNHRTPVKKFNRIRTQGSEIRGRGDEDSDWKKNINPEVTKMYDTFHLKPTRTSEIHPKISEEAEDETDMMSPRRSEVMLPHSSSVLLGSKSSSKLEQLYYLKRGQKAKDHEMTRTQISHRTRLSEQQMEEKLLEYGKQIQRLRKVEEQCKFLRAKFYKHVEKRHPEELNQCKQSE